eukprot:TRINITY_DN2268_c1_g2_i1.p1 TRINITY_DN2268_c1_g2~~TRINITY_DN2268_c1_g2_i1.p1  ORF type:complete len:155 (+),score=20.09 TRINITY_DN2268_c1_g2_i1:390-854(+)
MSLVNITGVRILKNPSKFSEPFEFEISFECIGELKHDLEWKVIYVGSAESEDHDQVLDSALVGPIPVGHNKFTFKAKAPDASKIPAKDLLGVTVVLLTCSYKEKEFIRVGYYVNNEYEDPALKDDPPAKPDVTKIQKNILAQKPRVTRFELDWD